MPYALQNAQKHSTTVQWAIKNNDEHADDKKWWNSTEETRKRFTNFIWRKGGPLREQALRDAPGFV